MKTAEIPREETTEDGGRDAEIGEMHLQAQTHQGLMKNTKNSELRHRQGTESP